MAPFFRVEVQADELIDSILGFVTEQDTARRNALPIARELQESATALIPFEMLETMVLDGVQARQDVADYVHYVLRRLP